MTNSKISIDVLFDRYFVPGTNILKKTAQLKCKSLIGLGWLQVGIRWTTFREQPRTEQAKWADESLCKAARHQNYMNRNDEEIEKKSLMYSELMRFLKDRAPEDW